MLVGAIGSMLPTNHEQALTFIDQRFAVGTTAILLVKASRAAG